MSERRRLNALPASVSCRELLVLHSDGKNVDELLDTNLADLSDEDLDTVNLKEITFMMKEGNMFDSNFSVAKLIEIFAIVNQMSTVRNPSYQSNYD
eukprot:1785239-Pleurochrysis_carterae.AAC.8